MLQLSENMCELKAQFARKGMNQTELARKLNMMPGTLSKRMANGGSMFTIREVENLVKELELGEEELFTIFPGLQLKK